MKQSILVDKIIDFCFLYDALDQRTTEEELRAIVEARLGEPHFVESLINTIIIKSKTKKGVDVEEVKLLLLELEKIRLELEYGSLLDV